MLILYHFFRQRENEKTHSHMHHARQHKIYFIYANALKHTQAVAKNNSGPTTKEDLKQMKRKKKIKHINTPLNSLQTHMLIRI